MFFKEDEKNVRAKNQGQEDASRKQGMKKERGGKHGECGVETRCQLSGRSALAFVCRRERDRN